MRRSLLIALAALVAVVLAAPALAGHNTYYKIKGGDVKLDVSASKQLMRDYGIAIDRRIGPLTLTRGGQVYHSKSSLLADFSAASRIKIKYDKRGDDGKKSGTATVSIKRLSLTVGKKKSYVIGTYKGTELRVFSIDGGKVRKAGGKYAYKFASGAITFNSELTNLLNGFGTPIGNKHASAKIDLGSISVRVR